MSDIVPLVDIMEALQGSLKALRKDHAKDPMEGDMWDDWQGNTLLVMRVGSKLITYRYTHWGAKERAVQRATFARMCKRHFGYGTCCPEQVEHLRTERSRP